MDPILDFNMTKLKGQIAPVSNKRRVFYLILFQDFLFKVFITDHDFTTSSDKLKVVKMATQL